MSDKKYLKKCIRAARFSRIIAKFVDLFICIILSLVMYPFGVFFAISYISIADSLQNGQSVGKKIMGFRVVSLDFGLPCSLKQSIVRNLCFSIPLIFSIIPIVGWIITLVIAPIFICFELYLIFKLDSALRLGDVMSDTTVIAPTGKIMYEVNNLDGWFQTGQSL